MGVPGKGVVTDLGGIVLVIRIRVNAVFMAQRGRHVLPYYQVFHHSVRRAIHEAANVLGAGGDEGIALQFPAERHRSCCLFRRDKNLCA